MILHTSHLHVRKNITMKYCICRTNVVMNYTETEAKVREATNDDAWGPTGTICFWQYSFMLLFTWNTVN